MSKIGKSLFLYLVVSGIIQTIYAQTAVISGELKKWHKISITFEGPVASETDPLNPFTDYAMNVTFKNNNTTIVVPGYFAADGNAAMTSSISGNKWRVHLNTPLAGTWTYFVNFRRGTQAAIDPSAGVPFPPLHGVTGTFTVAETDKTGKDFRSQGLLEHFNEHYFKFKGTGNYFLKNGTNSPENFLAFWEFDNTLDHGGLSTNLPDGLHHYDPHVSDWSSGDPTWQNGKGKGIIGAINYLSSEDVNCQYFLSMNVNGDGCEVFPWTTYDERLRFDVSKLAQWEIVFEHMQKKGILLHMVLQESENDKLLNQGNLGVERKLYYRELIARFAHHNALYWNLGEETNRSTTQLKADAAFFKTNDPYKHPIKVHSKAQSSSVDNLYLPLLGDTNFDATSLQSYADAGHSLALLWRTRSAQAGFKWVIELDEVSGGVGTDNSSTNNYTKMRKKALWGVLTGGGGGCEWFFPYDPNGAIDDIDCEDFRTRNLFWDYGRYALQFFTNNVPFHQMQSMDAIISNNSNNWVFASAALKKYVVYMSQGGTATINLPSGNWSVRWFNPRTGGELLSPVSIISGNLKAPDTNDWVGLIVPQGVSNPEIKITSPATGASFHIGTTIAINAEANDADGTISKVSFFANQTLLHEDFSSPYSFSWNTQLPGIYTVVARATDNSGLTGVDSVTITVTQDGNAAPVVHITAPPGDAEFLEGNDILITADASDGDGSIQRVEFYEGSNLLTSDNTSPYSFLWENVSSGSYTVTVTAVDNLNATSSNSIQISVNGNNNDSYLIGFTLINSQTGMPVQGFNPIANGATINLASTGTSINIRANTDFSPIGSVKFDLDGKSFRTENVAPYALAGDNQGNYNTWNAPLGTHQIDAKAYSNSNASGTLLDVLSLNITIVNTSGIMQSNTIVSDSAIIYPNPFFDEFTFSIKESEKIKELILLDAFGGVIPVKHECIDKNLCLVKAEKHISNGEYILKVRSQSEVRILRIIKQE